MNNTMDIAYKLVEGHGDLTPNQEKHYQDAIKHATGPMICGHHNFWKYKNRHVPTNITKPKKKRKK